MRGAVPLLPQYAFMPWCSVKAQGPLYFYLYHFLFYEYFSFDMSPLLTDLLPEFDLLLVYSRM